MTQNLFFKAAAAWTAMLFAAACAGADKLVFACDFSNQFQAQTSALPCHITPKDVKIVDVPGGKGIRFGKTNNNSCFSCFRKDWNSRTISLFFSNRLFTP